ncbi:MAG: hypothetical protein V4542_02025 [Pseudomonadota bacterium]
MSHDQHRNTWKSLHERWLLSSREANDLEHQLITALQLCVESRTDPPSQHLIHELTKARKKANLDRDAVDSFIVRYMDEAEFAKDHGTGQASQLPAAHRS